jgi:hypothetical protein
MVCYFLFTLFVSKFEDYLVDYITIAHQVEAILGVGKLTVGIGGIEQVQGTLGIYIQCLGKHYDDVALFAPQDGVSHCSSSSSGE